MQVLLKKQKTLYVLKRSFIISKISRGLVKCSPTSSTSLNASYKNFHPQCIIIITIILSLFHCDCWLVPTHTSSLFCHTCLALPILLLQSSYFRPTHRNNNDLSFPSNFGLFSQYSSLYLYVSPIIIFIHYYHLIVCIRGMGCTCTQCPYLIIFVSE